MRLLFIVNIILSILIVAGCASEDTDNPAALQSDLVTSVQQPPAQSASASVEQFNSIIPTNFTRESFCTGETIQFSGFLHIVGTIIENKNTRLGKGVVNYGGVKGIGLTRGTTYIFVDTEPFHTVIGPSRSFQIVTAGKIIGKGEAIDQYLQSLSVFTENANGEITATVDRFRIVCK